MHEDKPYVPSLDEVGDAHDSMGVKERLMSEMRDSDRRKIQEGGVPLETLSGIKFLGHHHLGGEWEINGHNIVSGFSAVGFGDLQIDFKSVDDIKLKEAFYKKYKLAMTRAEIGDEQYDTLAQNKIQFDKTLQEEVAREESGKIQNAYEAQLDELLS